MEYGNADISAFGVCLTPQILLEIKHAFLFHQFPIPSPLLALRAKTPPE
jgi:hypothetical protein